MSQATPKVTNDQQVLSLLPQREAKRPVLASLELVSAITSLREAYRKAIDHSDLTEGEVAAYLRIEPAQFSRVLLGKGRHLDDDLTNQLEVVCGNKIVSQWLAYQDGYELKSIESDLERENRRLREDNERLEAKYEVAKELIQGRVNR